MVDRRLFTRLFVAVVALSLLATACGSGGTYRTTAQADDPPPLCGATPATIWGTDGPDNLTGTDGDDVIVGLAGNDTITGGDGDDLICADAGDDMVTGDGGDDRLFGGQGIDTMSGGEGADTLHGNRGNDVLSGGEGDDRIFGYSQDDIIDGGPGNDRLHGHFGNDTIDGGDGDDAIFGYGDNDTMAGGPGADLMSGNFGDDSLTGGADDDTMFGADGDDTLLGNSGDDQLNGNSLDDSLDGGPGDDHLDGGIGNDICDGNFGTDTSTRCETRRNLEDSPIAALEAQWERERAAVVNRIINAGWGVTGSTLTGPTGWTVDLSACPSGWSDTAGIRGGTVVIGHTTAQSGALAAFGNIGAGMGEYFDYVNANGGIGPDGLQIELVIKDDAYVATRTQDVVDDLLRIDDPFYITNLGTPNTFAVRDTLNDACVPQPLSMSGHHAWGDPINYPWTTGLQMSYATEAVLWGRWIEQNFSAPVHVGALVMDNDFGLAYEQIFDRFAEESDVIAKVDFVRHDPAAATLTNEVTFLASLEPDVYISMTAGNPCVLAMQEAARSGLTDSAAALFQPSGCRAVSAYMAPAGDAADDWLSLGGGFKNATDPSLSSDPYISWMNDQIDAAGLDSRVGLYATGYGQFGWVHVQALQIAAELPGGLSRTNFMLALRALRMTHPALVDGITLSLNGSQDAYLVEGSDVSRFSSATQSWAQIDVLDGNGQTPRCAWIPGFGCA